VPFTGVFATNDLMAMGAMKRFWEAGLRIPEDISIVGCDGIAFTEYTTPPLSTLRTPVVTMGKTLMYQLLEKMQPGKTFPRPNQILQAEFVQRDSLGPARKDK
jgi:DNA-binding LacI/PurR family transcriptional regulator